MCLRGCYFIYFSRSNQIDLCCLNNRVVRGLDKDPSEVWFLMRIHVSLRVSVLKLFCNYSFGNILHSFSSKPFL